MERQRQRVVVETLQQRAEVGVEFDWYNKLTKDWLVVAPVLYSYGANAPYVNGGNVKNQGLEFGLHWNDSVGEVFYGVNLTGAHNKNKVTKIANADGIIHGTGSEHLQSHRPDLFCLRRCLHRF